MSSFLDRAATAGDEYEEAEKAAAHLQAAFPCVYQVLTGVRPKGELPGVAPGGIRIYTNGGQVKAMISGKGWENIGYLDCGPTLTSFKEIEDAISQGKIGWKKATGQTIPY